jgi:hypothetical protein
MVPSTKRAAHAQCELQARYTVTKKCQNSSGAHQNVKIHSYTIL